MLTRDQDDGLPRTYSITTQWQRTDVMFQVVYQPRRLIFSIFNLFCENLWIGSIKQKYLCIRNASCEKLWIIPISLDWSISPQSPLPHGVAWDEGKGKRRTGRKTGQLPERSYMEPVVLIEKKTVTSAHIFWELIHVQRILSMKCRLKELDYGGVGGVRGFLWASVTLWLRVKSLCYLYSIWYL